MDLGGIYASAQLPFSNQWLLRIGVLALQRS